VKELSSSAKSSIIAQATYSCGRYQVIKQRLNEAPRALLREFCAKDPLGDCQTMSEIDDNRDEIIRLQFRSDFRKPQEVPDKLTSVAKLLPMHFNKALPDTFASKSADLEFGTEHNPIVVSHQISDSVPHFFQPIPARRLFLQQRAKDVQVARLFLLDYSYKKLFLTVEV
jgi:hypothetical protein